MSVHSWNRIVVAADVLPYGGIITRKGHRLTAFNRGDPLRAPTADDLVCDAGNPGKVLFPLSNRKFVSPAEMDDVPNVEVAVAVIKLNPGPRNIHGAIPANGPPIEKVTCVASAS